MVSKRDYALVSKVAFILIGLVVGLLVGIGIFSMRAARRMEILASIMSSGQERLMITLLNTTMAHMASIHGDDTKLTPQICADFAVDMRESQGLFAVLAVGDASGEAICTSDPSVRSPLPTMKDRLYFERVKNANGLVMGEYTVSKTTGKPVLHFAYPIISNAGERRGFVLAGVDLNWFVTPELNQVFGESGVEVQGVDRNGKILFSYPSDESILGKNTLSAPLIAAMLGGGSTHKLAKGYDGKYRMYAYRWSGRENDEIAILASVKLRDYMYLWIATGLFGGLISWVLIEKLSKK